MVWWDVGRPWSDREFNHRTDILARTNTATNLMHEDNMMMLQFIVVDQPAGSMEYHSENVYSVSQPERWILVPSIPDVQVRGPVLSELGRTWSIGSQWTT